jgi:hypothetical protein
MGTRGFSRNLVFYALKHPQESTTLKKQMQGGKEIPFMGILRPFGLNNSHLFKPKNVN